MNKIFISHANADQEIVDLLSQVIERVSQKQVKVWFSSDLRNSGGLTSSRDYFQSIIDELIKCSMTIIVISPTSITRPWVNFEAGVACKVHGDNIIGARIGLNEDDVPDPIKRLNSRNLNTKSNVHKLLADIHSHFNLAGYDPKMADVYVEPFVKNISKFKIASPPISKSTFSALEEVKSYFDTRMNEILEKPSFRIDNSHIEGDVFINNFKSDNDLESYDILVEFNESLGIQKQYITIYAKYSVEDVMTEIYFLINDVIPAFSYLERWMVRNKSKGRNIIIKEVQEYIPASVIFNRDDTYEVIVSKESIDLTSELAENNYFNRVIDAASEVDVDFQRNR